MSIKMKPDHTVKARVFFLLPVKCIFQNPSNTVDMTIAKVLSDENDRPSVGRRVVALRAFFSVFVFQSKNQSRRSIRRMEIPSFHP